jgi:hypothetical protein
MVPGLLAYWRDRIQNSSALRRLGNEYHVTFVLIHMSRNTEKINDS